MAAANHFESSLFVDTRKIGELQNKTVESHVETHKEILEEVNDYVGLKKNLSQRLDRVIF